MSKNRGGIREYYSSREKANVFEACVYVKDAFGRPRKKRKSFLTKKGAVAWREAERTRIRRGYASPTRVTLGELCDDFLRRKRETVTAYHRHELVCRRLQELFSPSTVVTKLTPASVESFKAARRGAGASDRTLVRELDIVKHLFSESWRDDKRLGGWSLPVAKPKEPPSTQTRTLSPDEEALVEPILRRLCPAAADFFQLSLMLVTRRSELLLARVNQVLWHHVLYPNGAILIRGKGSRWREIPLTPESAAILRRRIECANFSASEWLFPSSRGGDKPMSHPTLYQHIARAFKEAGIPFGLKTGLTVHGFRRTGSRRLRLLGRASGLSPDVIAAYSGHSVATMLRYYQEATPEELLEAARLLSATAPATKTEAKTAKTRDIRRRRSRA
jgi:integrase